MDSYTQEESINSSEERVDNQSDRGVGRAYECVFCKRGFNTAQALGGHMNIHRKDRAKKKPTSKDCSNIKQQENHYFGPRFYQQILPASTTCSNYQSDNYSLSYATYLPEYSSNMSIRSHEKQPEINTSMINEDWRLSLSLDFTPKIMEKISHDEKEELDLELRLGYDY